MNYNQLSYNRSNPSHKYDFIPPIARKNRYQNSIFPQGDKDFTHDTRKHYNSLKYKSNIEDDHIMVHQGHSDHNRHVLDKQYERNLKTLDIEGASPSSLINKAVRNKYKAQDQFLKRENEYSRIEKLRQLQQLEQHQQSYMLKEQFKRNKYKFNLISGKYQLQKKKQQLQRQYQPPYERERKPYSGEKNQSRGSSEENSFQMVGRNIINQ